MRQQGDTWTDEAGNKIPVNRITKTEKMCDKHAYGLANKAIELSAKLSEFKGTIKVVCEHVLAAKLAELKKAPTIKGNFTWYNFDQTIKIECQVSESIRFDEILIEAAKEKLLAVISNNITGDDFIKEIVMDAFQTTAGKLDTKRILSLRRHTDKIKNASIRTEWEEAMKLIDKSVTRPDSKTYYRVSVKNAEGEFESIVLDFASVKPTIYE